MREAPQVNKYRCLAGLGLSVYSEEKGLMVCLERFYALAEEVSLLISEEGGADAHALLCGADRVEWIDSDAVIHQFAGEL